MVLRVHDVDVVGRDVDRHADGEAEAGSEGGAAVPGEAWRLGGLAPTRWNWSSFRSLILGGALISSEQAPLRGPTIEGGEGNHVVHMGGGSATDEGGGWWSGWLRSMVPFWCCTLALYRHCTDPPRWCDTGTALVPH